MLGKSTAILAAAMLMVGTIATAQAANDNQSDPTRGYAYGPMGQRMGGGAVNPNAHLSTGGRRGGVHVAPRVGAYPPGPSPLGAYAYVPSSRYGHVSRSRFRHPIWGYQD